MNYNCYGTKYIKINWIWPCRESDRW